MAVRRSTNTARRRDWTDHQIAILLDQRRDFFQAFAPSGRVEGDYETHPDVDAFRRHAWEDLCNSLLPRFIAAHPGQRPRCWWRYDSPERRLCVDGIHPHDQPGFPDHARRMWYGRPCCYATPRCWEAEFETQVEYLERLGLLTDDERALMPIILPAGVH